MCHAIKYTIRRDNKSVKMNDYIDVEDYFGENFDVVTDIIDPDFFISVTFEGAPICKEYYVKEHALLTTVTGLVSLLSHFKDHHTEKRGKETLVTHTYAFTVIECTNKPVVRFCDEGMIRVEKGKRVICTSSNTYDVTVSLPNKGYAETILTLLGVYDAVPDYTQKVVMDDLGIYLTHNDAV
jgi:hypothetical protein